MRSAEQGYLLVPAGLQSIAMRDTATVYATFGQALKIGERSRGLDLVTLAQLGHGQAAIQLGDTAEGVASLDEAMVAVTDGEVSPIVTGIVYCAVIEAFQEIFDLHRAPRPGKMPTSLSWGSRG